MFRLPPSEAESIRTFSLSSFDVYTCSLSRFALSLNNMPCRYCLLFCCCLFFGCGGSRLYDVRAVVTLDGEPLTGAEVTLLPERRNAASATGVTDEEGGVTFTTADLEGVFPGSYRAIFSKTIEERRLTNNEVRALTEAGIQYRPNIVEVIPENYTRRETSGLRVQIGYWRDNNLTFDLRTE